MSSERPSPFDKEPAEGSREVIDRELERQDHLPGAKVSGQPQGGAVDRAREEREKKGDATGAQKKSPAAMRSGKFHGNGILKS
ncbi:hypothetical protein ACTGJ9_013785 [Bradyrhizobium sp. RDM12]